MTSKAEKRALKRHYPKIEAPKAETVIAEGRAWVKVVHPRPWKPREENDAIVGELLSRSMRTSGHGSYGVVTLKTAQGPLTISGIVITSLFDAAALPQGTTVRVIFKGKQVGGSGFTYNDYELLIAKDELILESPQ